MSLLDDIIGNTTAYTNDAPVVVSENHDLGSINWVGGVTDPGEMIGCGRYQELRRLDGESDAAYQARLNRLLPTLPPAHREKIEKSMKAAAIKRAGLDTSSGRVAVMVAGETPWHNLGVHVRDAVDSENAIVLAGQNYDVLKQAMFFRNPVTGELAESSDAFSLVRSDTGVQLGTVGSRYQVIQNRDGFKFLDSVIGKFQAKYETAGAIHGGRKVWMQVKLPASSFQVAPGDLNEAYVTFVNTHDGSSAASAFLTSQRAVCNNTLRLAARDKGKGLTIRHTGSIAAKVADAQNALGLAVEKFEDYKADAEVLVRTRIAGERGYFNEVLDAILDITQERANLGAARLADQDLLAGIIQGQEARHKAELAYTRAITQRANILDDIVSRYESERCGVGGIRGTAWAAMNAVTESSDHGLLGQPGRKVGTASAQESRRFESVISGDIDDQKQVALNLALRMAV